jgi:hypothetical protein
MIIVFTFLPKYFRAAFLSAAVRIKTVSPNAALLVFKRRYLPVAQLILSMV